MADTLLLTYTVLDKDYQNGSLNSVVGETNGNVGASDIQNPKLTGIPLAPDVADPVIFSFPSGDSAHPVKFLMAKITTSPVGGTSSSKYSLIAPVTGGTWDAEVTDTSLTDSLGNPLAGNPHGVAAAGDWLYIIDYDTRFICILGKDELTSADSGEEHALDNAPFDLGTSTTAGLTAAAKGQAIIAIGNKLYALYVVGNASGTLDQKSVLVRLGINPATGALSYETHTNVGANAQEIIPIRTGGTDYLLIPAIGGYQNGGETNGDASDITRVPALGTWPATAARAIIGGADKSEGYDFKAIAASAREDGIIYILTGYYNSAAYSGFDWRLYTAMPSDMVNRANGVSLPDALLTNIVAVADQDTSGPGYQWDILFENNDTAALERLWFIQGSPILITKANAYGSFTKPPNAYRLFRRGVDLVDGEIGGQNINSADLTAETVRQAARSVSLKRAFHSFSSRQAAAAAKAAAEEEK